jgi:hypothetical protein
VAKYFSKDVRFYVGAFNPGPDTTNATIELTAPALDVTGFEDSSERSIIGRRSDGITWSGFVDDSTGTSTGGMEAAAFKLMSSAGLPSATNNVVSMLIGSATGGRAYVGTALLITVSDPVSLADTVKMEVTFAPDQVLDTGVHFGTYTKTGSGSTTAIDHGAITTGTNRWYLTVLGGTYGTGTTKVTLKHGTSAACTIGILGTVKGINGQSTHVVTFAGATQRYIRAEVSGTSTSVKILNIVARDVYTG